MPCLILAHFEIPSESTFLAHYIGSTVLLLLQSVRAMLYLAVEGYTWRPDDDEETNALYDKMSEEEVALGGLTSLEERAYNNLVEAEPINCRKKVTPDDSIGEARRDGLEVHEIVADLQYVLCAQGWCMLCIDLISRTRLQVTGSVFAITLPLSLHKARRFAPVLKRFPALVVAFASYSSTHCPDPSGAFKQPYRSA